MPEASGNVLLCLGSSLQTLKALLSLLNYVSFLCKRYKNKEKGREASTGCMQVVWGQGELEM